MQDIITAVSNFGFPIAITIYLLVRFEKKLDSLEESINNLSSHIKDLTKN